MVLVMGCEYGLISSVNEDCRSPGTQCPQGYACQADPTGVFACFEATDADNAASDAQIQDGRVVDAGRGLDFTVMDGGLPDALGGDDVGVSTMDMAHDGPMVDVTVDAAIVEDDQDRDGIADDVDNCPMVANPEQTDRDRDGIGDICDESVDRDRDGIVDAMDNCPDHANNGQADTDGDGVGNACDELTDRDQDGVADEGDNCPDVANADQADANDDGVGDACNPRDADGDGTLDDRDNCPVNANPEQEDTDRDGVGDLCDDLRDRDGDGVADSADNCPGNPNNVQADADEDGVGDLCDPVMTAVWITLEWNAITDLDLHLLHPLGRLNDNEYDCYSRNRSPDWGEPGLVRSDAGRRPGSVEQIRLDDPLDATYVVQVEDAQGERGATPRVTLNCRGNRQSIQTEIVDIDPFLWTAFRFNSRSCEVEIIDRLDPLFCPGRLCQCEEACPTGICAETMCARGQTCNFETGICE